MSNELRSLLARVEDNDPDTAKELRRHIDVLQNRRQFGLTFERHTPESVALTGRPISIGDKVRFLPPRGGTEAGSHATWIVTDISGPKSSRAASLIDPRTKDEASRAIEDLVFVADFRDPIYPGLTPFGEPVLRGGDQPFHTVINAENYHALEAMLFTYQGKVDCIYIDPPYNTGGKSSWLYNDDYVDGDDAYKHSKWLAFMERRLKLAKRLLADTGVLFVSIDDAETHRLRMLLDQVFGEENFVDTLAVEMSTTSGPKTVNAQQGTIVKNVEYVHIYRRSAAFDRVKHTPLLDGIDAYDTHYSLWLNEDGTIGSLAQQMMADDVVRGEIEKYDLVARGRFSMNTMDKLLAVSEPARLFIVGNLSRIASADRPPVSAEGQTTPVGHWVEFKTDHRTYLLTTLATGTLRSLMPLSMNYRMSDDYKPRFGRTVIRGDLWKGFHQDMGNVAKEGGVAFSNGKKPVRLIKQLIRWANNSPDALIVDFFGGSGTTAHAVMAMNAEDEGRRRAVLVTNNEVNHESAKKLRKKGLRPGDSDWEAVGVCEAVTTPRLINAATAMDANMEFLRLTYENPALVELDLAFERIAPLLWMRAGSDGRRIAEKTDTYEVAEAYAVLFSVDASKPFLTAVEKAEGLRVVYVVTDDETQYQAVAGQLPEGVESVRLYESYLHTFQINTGRA
ncbi:site-specific DNA-methyltransferase [Arthrobacter sp. AL08]|uniref:site-specific DNA-methyltransferase n=1 Tax=unclassified Arthrobacter TaxID=235627 RepID=UPI00249B8C81|nr:MULTISPECIES: site-specific DNA-methyltransferase [unclassified Arthrobacter]MDI3243033.1 site-specific DNA-methyltransferase [Arthrobacter sp. AL05]MDI3279043.1 site-specific DNA-methyltransferase [Arthrobacter sp. AL08]